MRALFAKRVEPLYHFNEVTRPNGADSSNYNACLDAFAPNASCRDSPWWASLR
jgi:hypothetical protein